MRKKILILVTISIGFLFTIGNAILLKFPGLNIQSFQDKFSEVHFMTSGNNFGGSFFWLAAKSVTGETITFNGQSKICTKLVRGLYFNSQRGKRLWPIDTYTLELLRQQNSGYNNLQISGGLYTTCSNSNPYSIYGAITYTRGGKHSYIVAGTKLGYTQNKILLWFANSLQYFDNKVPLGYIYDSNGGIGYVGGVLSGHESLINYLNSGGSIQSGFTYSWATIIGQNDRTTTIQTGNNSMETMRNMIIQGSVGLSKSIDKEERSSLLGNLENKTVIYNGSDINSSTLINTAKQKAQELCQGKEKNPDIATTNETLLCFEDTTITIHLDQPTTYNNKTIIVKSGNVILEWGMGESSPALDLFIDKGILYLPTESTFIGQTFTLQGFPGTPGINSGLYLKGNFIINGLIQAQEVGWFNHKLHLQGKITTLNTPLEPTTERINQIIAMFWSSIYSSTISLQNVFVRGCKLNGQGTDESLCTTGGTISTTPLVILNGNYPSNILE